MSKFVDVFKCEKCGRIYAGNHYNRINNIYPILSGEKICTWINDFPDRNRTRNFQVQFCNGNVKYHKKILMSGHREYFEIDECLKYYVESSMKELCG